ncbi:MAG TPA: GPR endopeptidase [Clostridia bacterium]|nr:GPR endopeptidase [Clostridia bacterium]
MCAIAPGVLGVTGVETMDIVFGVANKVKPDLIIAVDALASRRAARISTTIQLSDSGISPGSGVGNTRADLSRANLGVPVIAIGVPLVVYASTISQDTISLIADETGLHGDEARLRELAEQVIAKHMGDFIVTPKDIDVIVEDMAGIIANAIPHCSGTISSRCGICLRN